MAFLSYINMQKTASVMTASLSLPFLRFLPLPSFLPLQLYLHSVQFPCLWLSTCPLMARSFFSFSSCASTFSRSRRNLSFSVAMASCLCSCCRRYLRRCSLATRIFCWDSICCCCLIAMSRSSLSVASTPVGN